MFWRTGPGEHSRVPLESEAVIWGAQMSLRSLLLPPVHLGSWGLGRGAEEWERCPGTVGDHFLPRGEPLKSRNQVLLWKTPTMGHLDPDFGASSGPIVESLKEHLWGVGAQSPD